MIKFRKDIDEELNEQSMVGTKSDLKEDDLDSVIDSIRAAVEQALGHLAKMPFERRESYRDLVESVVAEVDNLRKMTVHKLEHEKGTIQVKITKSEYPNLRYAYFVRYYARTKKNKSKYLGPTKLPVGTYPLDMAEIAGFEPSDIASKIGEEE